MGKSKIVEKEMNGTAKGHEERKEGENRRNERQENKGKK